MADIRLVRPRGDRLWLLMGAIALAGLLLWGSAFVFGDATDPEEQPRVGAAADFGAVRAPVLPVSSVPFQTLLPVQQRDLGRLVRLNGVAESGRHRNAVWVRAASGHRILVRFEPEPPAEQMPSVSPGRSVDFEGYLQKISRAEFLEWADSLRISIPRPPPARKFGDLPDPSFARVDSLFIREYYISVRPQGMTPAAPAEAVAAR
jgi:hypothetical protein